MNKWNVQCVLIALCVVGSGTGMELNITEDSINQFFDAVKHSHIDQMKKIITQNPAVVSAYRYWPDLKEEVTPLHVAAHQGDITSLELLLENERFAQCGAETKNWKRIPLHCAANKTTTKMLLKHRHNAKSEDVFGKTPFEIALDDWPARYDVAHYLLKHGGDIDAVERFDSNRVLHRVACCNNIDKMRFLLQHNANPAVYNSDGKTLLAMAIERRHYQIIELFKKVRIFFISDGQCNLFTLLQNNAQKLRSLESGGQYEIGIVNLLAQLLMCVRSSHRYDNRQEIVINSEGITFKHSSRDDLCTLFSKESINYVEQLIDAQHVRVKTYGYIYRWQGDRFQRKVLEYPFVLAYDKDKAFDILLMIMMNGDTDFFELLFTDKTSHRNGGLVFKPDLSGVDGDGNTLLHRVIEMVNCDDNNQGINKRLIRILIENNIDLMHRNNGGKTALDCVKELGSIDDCINFRDICADKFFNTPSYVPEYKNIKKFLKSGFDINACILRGLSWHGSNRDFIDKIILLLKYDALVTENMIKFTTSDYIRALLQKKYAEQECFICYEHFSGMSDIPCGSSHKNRICKGCYTGICEKNDRPCPLCRGQLGKYPKDKDKKCA